MELIKSIQAKILAGSRFFQIKHLKIVLDKAFILNDYIGKKLKNADFKFQDESKRNYLDCLFDYYKRLVNSLKLLYKRDFKTQGESKWQRSKN